MFDKLRWRCLCQRAQAQQPHIVAVLQGRLGFAHRLPRVAQDARYLDEGAGVLPHMLVHRLRRQRQHRLQQTVFGLMQLELGRMHTHGHTARARRAVVAGQRALAPLIQLEVGGKSKRVGRDDLPVGQMLSQFRQSLGHQKLPSRVSKWVGLSSDAPSFCTQSAIHCSIWCSETRG